MSVPKGGGRLDFACECVSAEGGYGDPWAPVAQNRMLPNGTKERILTLVAREPRTIAQLAAELELSNPSVHTHVSEMVASELLREARAREKKHPAERYYEPNFPVVDRDERAEFEAVCGDMADRVADLFESHEAALREAFERTALAARGWRFEDLSQYLFAKVQRRARERLEARGALEPRAPHRNGVDWVFWAEHAERREPS
jgi:predicted ArsR family transcriptional regulator